MPEQQVEQLVRDHFDLRPAAILRDLDLRRPIFAKTAAYGHPGRDDRLHLGADRPGRGASQQQGSTSGCSDPLRRPTQSGSGFAVTVGSRIRHSSASWRRSPSSRSWAARLQAAGRARPQVNFDVAVTVSVSGGAGQLEPADGRRGRAHQPPLQLVLVVGHVRVHAGVPDAGDFQAQAGATGRRADDQQQPPNSRRPTADVPVHADRRQRIARRNAGARGRTARATGRGRPRRDDPQADHSVSIVFAENLFRSSARTRRLPSRSCGSRSRRRSFGAPASPPRFRTMTTATSTSTRSSATCSWRRAVPRCASPPSAGQGARAGGPHGCSTTGSRAAAPAAAPGRPRPRPGLGRRHGDDDVGGRAPRAGHRPADPRSRRGYQCYAEAPSRRP